MTALTGAAVGAVAVKKTHVKALSESEIIAAILALYEAGFKVNDRSMKFLLNTEEARAVIFKAIGRFANASNVHTSAIQAHKKNWRWWIEKAGLNYDDVMGRTPQLNFEEIEAGLTALAKAGYGTSVDQVLQADQFEAAVEAVSAAIGRRVKPSKLYYDGGARMGKSWPWWRQHVAERILSDGSAPTMSREQITSAMIEMSSRQLSFALHVMLDPAREGEYTAAVRKATGTRQSVRDLLNAATRAHNQLWSRWVIELKTPLAAQTMGLDESEVPKVIHEFHKAGLPLAFDAFRMNRASPALSAVFRAVGRMTTPLSVQNDAVYFHGRTWVSWLEAAGVDWQSMRFSLAPVSAIAVAAAGTSALDLEFETLVARLIEFRQSLSESDRILLDGMLDTLFENPSFDVNRVADGASIRALRYYAAADVERLLKLIAEWLSSQPH